MIITAKCWSISWRAAHLNSVEHFLVCIIVTLSSLSFNAPRKRSQYHSCWHVLFCHRNALLNADIKWKWLLHYLFNHTTTLKQNSFKLLVTEMRMFLIFAIRRVKRDSSIACKSIRCNDLNMQNSKFKAERNHMKMIGRGARIPYSLPQWTYVAFVCIWYERGTK